MIMFTALLYSLRTHDTKGSWGWREKHIKGQCWPKGLRSKPVTPTQVPGPVGQTWVGRWKAALFPPFLVATTECPWARPLTPTAQTVVVLSSFQVCNSVNVIRAFLQNLSNHQNIFFFFLLQTTDMLTLYIPLWDLCMDNTVFMIWLGLGFLRHPTVS